MLLALLGVFVMARGGARNRSGPTADPNSARSDARGLSFAALPTEGFAGRAPAFPIQALTEVNEETGRKRVTEISKREKVLWREYWKLPQAAAWAEESWRWQGLALMCRLEAQAELFPAKSATLVGQLHRFRDQMGLTPAGLKENGWQIGGPVASESREPVRAARPSGGSRSRVLRVAE